MELRRTILLLLSAVAVLVLAELPSSIDAEASTFYEQLLSLYSYTIPPSASATAAAFESALASEIAANSRGYSIVEATISELVTDAAARQSNAGELGSLYPEIFGGLLSTATTTPAVSGASQTPSLSTTMPTASMTSASSSASSSPSRAAAPNGLTVGGALGVVGLAVVAVL